MSIIFTHEESEVFSHQVAHNYRAVNSNGLSLFTFLLTQEIVIPLCLLLKLNVNHLFVNLKRFAIRERAIDFAYMYILLYFSFLKIFILAAPGLACCFLEFQSLRGLWDYSSCRMWDLVPWQGIEPGPHALGPWSLSPWTTREVPRLFIFYFLLSYNCSFALFELLDINFFTFSPWMLPGQYIIAERVFATRDRYTLLLFSEGCVSKLCCIFFTPQPKWHSISWLFLLLFS